MLFALSPIVVRIEASICARVGVSAVDFATQFHTRNMQVYEATMMAIKINTAADLDGAIPTRTSHPVISKPLRCSLYTIGTFGSSTGSLEKELMRLARSISVIG